MGCGMQFPPLPLEMDRHRNENTGLLPGEALYAEKNWFEVLHTLRKKSREAAADMIDEQMQFEEGRVDPATMRISDSYVPGPTRTIYRLTTEPKPTQNETYKQLRLF